MEAGTRLGPYQIVEQLGAGGMGVVYLARDTRLDRDVAIKVLPQEFARDEARRARFEREAKLLAKINHPNIASIYGLEDAADQRFIAMERVAGPTLAEKLEDQGALALDESLEVARQISQALEAAHEAGIVHRDLKPANVKITPEGRVKVLDFGIAKELTTLPSADATRLPTEPTGSGVIVGTVPYMSPEQVRGGPVDDRTDIWSFGCLLYESITGRRPFDTPTPSDTMASILKDDPDWRALPAGAAPEVGRLLRRCLHKDPEQRLQRIGDARIEIVDLIGGGSARVVGVQAARAAEWPQGVKRAAAAAAVVLGLVVTYQLLGPESASQPAVSGPPRVTPFLIGDPAQDHPAWNPSGSTIAYTSDQAGNPDIWITDVTGSSHRNLTADFAGIDDFAAWSPDGTRIAFYSEREGPGIYAMTSLGGRIRKLASLGAGVYYAFSLRWAVDGNLIYTDFDGQGAKQVYGVAEGAGSPRCLTCLLNTEGKDGDLSPDGNHLTFTSEETGPRATLFLGDLRTGDVVEIADGADRPRWTSDGDRVVFLSARDGVAGLWEVAIDRVLGVADGAARRITSGLELTDFALHEATGKGLAVRSRATAHIWRVPADDAVASLEEATQVTLGDAMDTRPRWLPDGSGVVFESNRRGAYDIWALRFGEGDPVQLTAGSWMDLRPRPSPRGDWIIFDRKLDGLDFAFAMRLDGSDVHPLLAGASDLYSTLCCLAWSPDGSTLAASVRRKGESFAELMMGIAPFDSESGTAAGFDLHDLPGSGEEYGSWSRDGRVIVYESNLEGDWDLWIVNADGSSPRRLTDDPGNERHAAWSMDGAALYYLKDYREILRIPMGDDGSATGPARPWLQLPNRAVPYPDSLDFHGTSALLSISDLATDIWLVEFDAGALRRE